MTVFRSFHWYKISPIKEMTKAQIVNEASITSKWKKPVKSMNY